MKRLIWLLILAFIVLGCGGDNGGNPQPGSPQPGISHPPQISDLIILCSVPCGIMPGPTYILPLNAGGGTVTITGQAHFLDPDADVDTLWVTSTVFEFIGTVGKEISESTEAIDVSNQSLGRTSGTITQSTIIETSKLNWGVDATDRLYFIGITVQDAKNNQSNPLGSLIKVGP